MVGKLKLYDPNIPADAIVREREAMYLGLSTVQKIQQLFELITLSVKMHQNKPIKKPQGKGIVLYRLHHD